MHSRWVIALTFSAAAAAAYADGPADNLADKVRPIPPPGVALPDADKAELTAGVEKLGAAVAELKSSLAGKPELLDLLPDVQIYHNALRYALQYNEIFNLKELPKTKDLLKAGLERAAELKEGKHSWTSKPGPSARGYVSKIDGSVQPYGLLIPASYDGKTENKVRHRLDLWCHGRGETLSELNFVSSVSKSGGEFQPKDAFVIQLYGRFCCANKLAGEIDALEAIDAVKKHYPIDDNRIVIRGFSMGGAACWQFAVHYTDLWACAAPGAGFSETQDFLKVFQNEPQKPTWYEQKLWHVYDCTDYALNIFNLPTIAYSGEIDKQKQAADMMEKAMAKEGLKLVHLIGPKTGHSYHKETKLELIKLVDAAVEKGRNPNPEHVKLVTYTLRYNRMFWVTIDGMEKHWERAQVEADRDGDKVTVKTAGVTALSLRLPPHPTITIDGTTLTVPAQAGAPAVATIKLHKADGKWALGQGGEPEGLHKRHGLQGPIDDAFLDSFLMVKPTGTPLNEKVGKWADAEMHHAIKHWRQQYRGEARVKADGEISDADIAEHNLVLWGDPSSNKVLAKIADKLPIKWTADGVVVGDKKYSADKHVPVLVYPNPLNPKKYIVLNSGFTFREYDYLNNARQIPKLPDWAVVDTSMPMTSRAPGGIAAAGFFGEKWEVTKGE